MRALIVCDTPLQLLNAIQWLQMKKKEMDIEADLFIYHQFKTAEKLSENIRKSDLFNEIYDIRCLPARGGASQKLITLSRLIFPKIYITKYMINRKKLEKNYSIMAIFFQTPLTYMLHMIYKQTPIVLLEDGIGTYFGNILSDYSSPLFNRLDKYIWKGTLKLVPEEVYVHNPGLCKSKINVPVKKIPSLKEVKEIKRIFDYSGGMAYKEHRCIYLTQPLDEKTGFLNNESMLLESLTKDLLVRVHPRQDSSLYEGYFLDTDNNMWELECIYSITSNHILLGAFSTAQFMPKILMDSEPYVFFLYKIYFPRWYEEEFWIEAHNMITRLKELYKMENRIFEPESIEEFNRYIDEIGASCIIQT